MEAASFHRSHKYGCKSGAGPAFQIMSHVSLIFGDYSCEQEGNRRWR